MTRHLTAAVLLWCGATTLAANRQPLSGPGSNPQAASRTALILLGTGNPVPNPDRFGPATVILVDNVPYAVDAGVGVVRRWMGAVQKHHLGLNAWDLKRLFVTHLHTDHTLGLAELIFTPWTIEGDRRTIGRPQSALAIEAFGPRGLRAMTGHLIAAYAEDIRVRTSPGGEHAGGTPPVVNVHEVDAGVVFHDERVTVTAFRVPHGTWPQAFGYKFVTPDKTIVVSGDTAFAPEIAKQCNGCDVLVHEGGIAGDDSAYFRAFHTSAAELGRLARDAKPKLLVLSHQRGDNEEGLRAIRREFDGQVVVGRDLDRYE